MFHYFPNGGKFWQNMPLEITSDCMQTELFQYRTPLFLLFGYIVGLYCSHGYRNNK